jgi:hypothetical protein
MAHLQRGPHILDQAVFDEHIGLKLRIGVDHRPSLSHQIAEEIQGMQNILLYATVAFD